MAPVARAACDTAARHRRPFRLPLPVVPRAALRAARGSQSRQLPVAAADRPAHARVAARLAARPRHSSRRRCSASPARRSPSASRRSRDQPRALGFALAAGSALAGRATRCSCAACRRSRRGRSAASRSASGLLALACHALFEPPASFARGDALKLLALGLGPMGARVLPVGRRDEARRSARGRRPRVRDAAPVDGAAASS